MVTLEGAHYIVPAGAQKVGAFRVNFMIFFLLTSAKLAPSLKGPELLYVASQTYRILPYDQTLPLLESFLDLYARNAKCMKDIRPGRGCCRRTR